MRGLLALLILLCALPRGAHADWEIKRSAFDPQLVRQYKQTLQRNPADSGTRHKLAALYRKYRTVRELEREYEKDSSESGKLVLGFLYQDRGDLDDATAQFISALQDKLGSLNAHLALGEVLVASGKHTAAVAHLEAALAGSSGTQRLTVLRLLTRTVLSPQSGMASKEALGTVRKYYRELFAAHSNDLDLRREWAEALATHGEPKEAAGEWREIAARIVADPQRKAEALKRVGELDEVSGEEDAALTAYDEAATLLPAKHPLRHDLNEALISIYRKRDALHELIALFEKRTGFDDWALLGKLYDEVGDGVHAEEYLRRAIGKDSHALTVRKALIAILERQGRTSDVIAEYRKLLSISDEPSLRLELADKLWKSGDRQAALTECDRIGARTRDPSIHSALSELYLKMGESERAQKEEVLLAKLEPDDPSHIVALGESYFTKGNPDKAIEIWKRLLTGNRRHPENAQAALADTYLDHELLPQALELYQKALSEYPQDLRLQKGLATTFERMQRDSDAVRVWEKRIDLAIAKMDRSAISESRHHLLALLKKSPLFPSRLAAYRARFERATNSLEISGYGLLYAELGLGRSGGEAEADRILQQLTKRAVSAEDQADALETLANLHRARGRVKEAILALKEEAALMPSRKNELYAQIAELSLLLYRDADALTYAKKAVELSPADAAAQKRLAEVYEQKDDLTSAAGAYHRALELDDRQWKTFMSLGRLELRRGNLDEAARLYREVMRRAPEEEEELVLDATRRAVELDSYLGKLGELEREFAPVAFAHFQKHAYRELLLNIEERVTEPLAARARGGDRDARKELNRIGEHALRPLLALLVSGDGGEPADQRQAIALLGELGPEVGLGAAAPLLKIALGRENATDLRIGAATSAARLSSSKQSKELERLSHDDEKQIALAGLWGLVRVHSPSAIPALERILTSASLESLRGFSCVALAGSGEGALSGRTLRAIANEIGDEQGLPEARAGCALAIELAAAAATLPPETVKLVEPALERAAKGPESVAEPALRALIAIAPTAGRRVALENIFSGSEAMRRAALRAMLPSASGNPAPRSSSLSVPPIDEFGFNLRRWLTDLGAQLPRPVLSQSDLAADLLRVFTRALSASATTSATTEATIEATIKNRALLDLGADGTEPNELFVGPFGSAHQLLEEPGARQLTEGLKRALASMPTAKDPALAARAKRLFTRLQRGAN